MFKLRPEHATAFRKQAYRRTLAQSFRSSGLASDEEDTSTDDLLVRDPKGRQARVTFDSQGFISGTVSQSGRAWKLENDAKGRMLGFTNPAGLRSSFERNSNGQVVRLSQNGKNPIGLDYDPKGFLTRASYSDRTARSLSYDPAGRVTSIGDRRGNTDAFEYNAQGLISAVVDANGNRTQFHYGGWDRPDRTQFADGSSESYRYTPEGFPGKIVSGSDLFAEIEYSPKGRPTKIALGDGEEITFTYNDKGSIVNANNSEIRIEHEYDDKNRVVLEKQGDQVVQYFYDETGSLVAMAYPTGERVEFSYDDDLRLASVTDWKGGLHRITYNSDDLSLQVLLPSGLKRTIRSEATGLPSSILVTRGSSGGSALFSFQYDYDEENRVRRFSDSQFGSRDYIYDPESQLLEVRSEKPERNESFAYDPAGNRIRANGAGSVFNSLNQLTRQGGNACQYDVRGNLVSLPGPDGEWNFQYDARNLLVSAKGPREQRVSFGYDAFGRRLWKRSGSTEVRYIWAGELLLREVTQTGSRASVRDYLYFPGTCVPLATRLDGRIYSYHTDLLGTPRRLTDEKGTVVWAADFSAFGEAHIQIETIPNPLRFPGHYFDQETGLHYNRFRYYSTTLGRYLSRDPVGFLGGINFYAYAHSDPINAFDVYGLSWWGTALSIVGAVVAGAALGLAIVTFAPALLVAAGLTAATATLVAGGAAIIASGVLAGAVGYGLNEGFTNGWNFSCIVEAAKRGALVGLLASIPFLFLPAVGAGALGGAIAYLVDWKTDPNHPPFSLLTLIVTSVISALTAGLASKFGPRIATWLGVSVASEIEEPISQAVIGHNPEYVNLANELGAQHFLIPIEEWNAMTPTEQWAANQKFLDEMIARGDEVILATKASNARPGSTYARELEYLAGKGYSVSADGFHLIAPGK